MRYAFFGNTEFSAIVLDRLVKGGLPPARVVSNPDRPAGRAQTLTPPPLARAATKAGIPVSQPERLDEETIRTLSSPGYDFFVLADYGKMFPKAVLEIPRLGTVGVHVSLLPKYRGASPMQTALLNGEKETGVTLYLLDEKLDHGPVLAARAFPIERMAFTELKARAAETAGDLLGEMLPRFAEGTVTPVAQNEAEATFTRKFTADDGFVEPGALDAALAGRDPAAAESIARTIRALNPEPGAWTTRNGKRLKLLAAELSDGTLVLKRTQLEGKKPVDL